MNFHDLFSSAFDRIYILNLPERDDRRREIQEQLKLVGLSLESPLIHLFPAIRPTEKGEWESIGARGCFTSHLEVLKQAERDQLRSIMILEDDANWSRSFLNDPKPYLNPLASRDWGFFDCGGPINDRSSDSPAVIEADPQVGIITTHCIGLKGQAIGRAAAYLQRITLRKYGDPQGGPMHVDGAYSWFRRENPDVLTLSFKPTMAYQRSSVSNIGKVNPLDRIPAIAPALRIYRALKNKVRQ